MLEVLKVRVLRVLLVLMVLLVSAPGSAQTSPERPFGTLREQAAMQQAWLQKRLDTFLPALMRKHGIDLWVVPMREYNEDPVFSVDHRARNVRRAAADDLRVLRHLRRRSAAAPAPACVKRIALGGTSQGGVFEARRSTKAAARRRRAAASRPSSGATNSGRSSSR